MIESVKKMLKKDLAVASNIGKWLIIIALSGIALYFLFGLIIAILAYIYIAPRLKTLVERLRNSPDMKKGSTKDKCITAMKETILVMFPEQLKDIKFVKDTHEQIIKRCDNAKDAASLVNSVSNLVGTYDADDHTSPAYDSHKESSHAAAAASHQNLQKKRSAPGNII